jgi:hypothetical protein
MIDVKTALETDRTIDIVTVGAKTGISRTTEIWFTNIQGRIIICGTPSADGSPGRYKPRDWLANLKANPEFQFCLKESIKLCMPARAVPIIDTWDRRQIMSAPATSWYREQGSSIDDLVAGSPIVEVTFLGDYIYLNLSTGV